jgi:hypothetical protein
MGQTTISRTSSDMRRNRSSTFRGLRSSCTARFTYIERSFCASIAPAKLCLNRSSSSAVFFARNLSWIILRAPAFLTVPFVAEQYEQYMTLRHAALTALHSPCRCRFSSPGRRKRFKYVRLSGSSRSTRAQVYSQGMSFVRD